MISAAAVAHADPYRLRNHVAAVPGPERPKTIRCVFPWMVRTYIQREGSRVAQCAAQANVGVAQEDGLVSIVVERLGVMDKSIRPVALCHSEGRNQ